MPDEGRILRENILPFGPRVSASLVPNLFDSEMSFESGRKIRPEVHGDNNFYSKNSKISLGMLPIAEAPIFMEGYRHCCEGCFLEGRDPYHEYVCANGTAQDITTQYENTNAGIKLLENEIGELQITGLVPPNHQGDESTRDAARILNIQNYVVRNSFADYPFPIKFSLPAWHEGELNILPESRKPGKSPLLYIMYSDIVKKGWKTYESFFEKSVSLSELEIKASAPMLSGLSEWLLYKYKKARDLKRKLKR
ncbi:MAG: hypothetical protein PVJ67_06300 [Candidatus Pacearchaeota archaeon]|jgi:hypothetical protein